MGWGERLGLNATEIYWYFEDRADALRRGKGQIIRVSEWRKKYQLGPDAVGRVVAIKKLNKIFGERGRERIQAFANDLKRRGGCKFAVSEVRFRFERDPNMMFFEIGDGQEREKGVEIVYLGTGKTGESRQIGNEFAADSWGFAVLNLREDSGNGKRVSEDGRAQ